MLLEVVSRDGSGAISSRLIPLKNIVDVETRIRYNEESSIFDEQSLVLTRKDGSEVTVDAASVPHDFILHGDDGEIAAKTRLLSELNTALIRYGF